MRKVVAIDMCSHGVPHNMFRQKETALGMGDDGTGHFQSGEGEGHGMAKVDCTRGRDGCGCWRCSDWLGDTE